MDKKDIISILYSNDIKLITDTLLYITYNVDEWKWVQDECLSLIIKTPYDDVKRLAIVCIGHLCRIHQKIEKDKVILFLIDLKEIYPELIGTIDDTIDDIKMFG